MILYIIISKNKKSQPKPANVTCNIIKKYKEFKTKITVTKKNL